MRHLLRWLTAISLIACIEMVYLYLGEVRRVALMRADGAASEMRSRQEVVDLKQRLAAANAAARNNLERLDAKKVGPQTPPETNPLTFNASDIVREYPEFEALLLKQRHRQMMFRYGSALAAFNLPPVQLEKLKKLLTDRIMSDTDGSVAAMAAGLKVGTPAYNEAIKQATESIQQQITALIGVDGQAKLEESDVVANQKVSLKLNEGDFAEAGVSLTTEQNNSLAQSLYDVTNTAKFPSAGASSASKVDPATGLTPIDDHLLAQASGFLSPAQIEILKNQRIEQNQMSSIVSKFVRLHNPNGDTEIDP